MLGDIILVKLAPLRNSVGIAFLGMGKLQVDSFLAWRAESCFFLLAIGGYNFGHVVRFGCPCRSLAVVRRNCTPRQTVEGFKKRNYLHDTFCNW